MLIALLVSTLIGSSIGFRSSGLLGVKHYYKTSLSSSLPPENLGGKLVVTGLEGDAEDEFTMGLLHEQAIWKSVVLATPYAEGAQKHMISRTSRYSGLLDVLKFAQTDVGNTDQLISALEGANAWLAFNVEKDRFVELANIAMEANIPRIIFTTTVTEEEEIEQYVQTNYDSLLELSKEKGLAMTIIRHGEVIDGNEDFPYQIVNATTPLVEKSVPRGVLGRIATELVRLKDSNNQICGLSSSGDFAKAYLELLRSTGLTRRQEVFKVYTGGMDVVYQKTEEKRRKREAEEKERQEMLEERRLEREAEERMDKALRLELASAATSEPKSEVQSLPSTFRSSISSSLEVAQDGSFKPIKPRTGSMYYDDNDEESDEELFVERKIKNTEDRIQERAQEILEEIYHVYNTRLITKVTDRGEFYKLNDKKARELATKEIQEEDEAAIEKEMQRKVDLSALDRVFELESRQYAKLIQLERKEMQQQKDNSDIWVKYIYLLIEETMRECAKNDILFHNLDEFQQTLLLRKRANALRAKVNLPPYEVVYDALDAKIIVDYFSNQPTEPLTQKYQLQRTADEILVDLNKKYGKMLKNVAALRGATQIIELAIETLSKKLPPVPPKPQEMGLKESMDAQKKMNELRLSQIRNRMTPFAGKEETVGRL